MPLPKRWIPFAILAAVLAAAALIYGGMHIDFSRVSVDGLQARIESYGVWGPAVFILLFQFRTLFLIPLGLLTPLAGAIWGWTGFLYMMIALNICIILQFLGARYPLHESAQRYIHGRLDFLNRYLQRNAFWTIFLLRLIPNILLDVQNFGLALTKVRFRDYYIASLLGVTPGTLAHVGLGHSLIGIQSDPRLWWELGLVLALLAGLFWAQHVIRRRMDVPKQTPEIGGHEIGGHNT